MFAYYGLSATDQVPTVHLVLSPLMPLGHFVDYPALSFWRTASGIACHRLFCTFKTTSHEKKKEILPVLKMPCPRFRLSRSSFPPAQPHNRRNSLLARFIALPLKS